MVAELPALELGYKQHSNDFFLVTQNGNLFYITWSLAR